MTTTKHIEWKTLLVGSIATLIIVIVCIVISSTLTDLILFSIYGKPFHFSLFPKSSDGFAIYSIEPENWTEPFDHFHKLLSQVIGLIASVLGYFLGGFFTAKKAKSWLVFHGAIAGAVSAVVLLSRATPIYVAGAYFGAMLASRKKASGNLAQENKR